jgi:DNA-directed RNA polymerase specialized sigma24 family protein
MARKHREFPTDPTDAWQEGKIQFGARAQNKLHAHRSMTSLESLMQLAPGQEETILPIEITLELKEILADVIEELSPLERWIVERLFIEGMSLRKAGAVLGIPKTSLARRRDKIRLFLKEKLEENPVIQDFIEINGSFNLNQ